MKPRELSPVLPFPEVKQLPRTVYRESAVADSLFEKATVLSEKPETVEQAITLYLQIVSQVPTHVSAWINLGVLRYHRHEYEAAENCYKSALSHDPDYALAHFDLGNVYDETGRLKEAVESYKSAIKLAPSYADAHYNLALSYERLGLPLRALPHWARYAKLDCSGPWSDHARLRVRRAIKSSELKIVSRRGVPA